MCSSEAAPFAKSGGLGDVFRAHCQALAKIGHDVGWFFQKYGCIRLNILKKWNLNSLYTFRSAGAESTAAFLS